MVTSEQVARLAGVSRATVSRVLNGSAHVSEETKKRIYAAVATLGYGTNALDRSLLPARSRMLAIALFGGEDGLNFSKLVETQFFFYLELLRLIEREVASESYDLFFPSHPYHMSGGADDPETNYVLALRAKQVEGLIGLSVNLNDPRIQGVCRSNIPAVFIDSAFQGSHATYVKSDYMDGARQATEHLLQLGHRRIAYFQADALALTGMERHLGYQQAMAHAGLITDPALVRPSGWESKEAYQAAMTLLNERRDFTAIFAASDMMAIGILRALHKHGLRVPEDISLVGFDGLSIGEDTDPPLTTVQQDIQTISQKAVASLFQLMKEEEAPAPVIVPTNLLVRASTGPAPTN